MTTALPSETLSERPDTVNTIRIYLRQSREQEQQKESIPTQRAECARLADLLGLASRWSNRVEYIDIDRSGDDFTGREELTRLLREASPGDRILAWKQDRLGRDMIDSAAAIRELVKYRQCALYTVETGTVAVTLDSAEQTAMVMFRGMVAQGELERIRSRTRDGLRQRARRVCEWSGAVRLSNGSSRSEREESQTVEEEDRDRRERGCDRSAYVSRLSRRAWSVVDRQGTQPRGRTFATRSWLVAAVDLADSPRATLRGGMGAW